MPSPEPAWAAFYHAHRRALASYALSLVGSNAEAEDLLQDVLVRMVREDRPIHNVKAYVFRCLRNGAIDRRRARAGKPQTQSLDVCEVTFLDRQSEDIAQRETAERVRVAIRQLAPAQREVIVLRIYCGLRHREIAAILDQPIGTVASTYSRGLQELRSQLEREVGCVG